MTWQKILYGALFSAALPVLLVLWAAAAQKQIAMPLYGSPLLARVLIAFGLSLMALAMRELWRFGGGLPMNAFPPPFLVSRGTYRYFPHPIYTGFAAVCLGASMFAESRSGLWLITPAAVAGCVALVLGYEQPDLIRRFGRTLQFLPANDGSHPSTIERIRFLLHVLIPWLALYEFTIHLPLHGTAFSFPFEQRMPVLSWTVLAYLSTYPAVVLAPWAARTRADLRQLILSAWFAMLVVFPFYWLVPSSAPRRAVSGSGWMVQLLLRERATYPPVAALPSFHVLWSIFVARLYRPRWLGWSYVVAVAVSCVTTGMHYIGDVLAALLIVPLFLEPIRVWNAMRDATERVANSWREWRLGPIRVINHALYAGLAAFAHIIVVLAAVGTARRWQALLIALTGLIGAGVWAQWVEGSALLKRPFGFYGGLIAAGIASLCFRDRWLFMAANCLGAPWMQAFGRLRCLVNGCCHGRETTPAIGIRVSHPRSRVTRLSDLAGVPIHPTQLYSMMTNTALGLLLLTLWTSGCSLALICGIYGVGNGLSRFAEEAYRGEPQTPSRYGLRLYQWMAIASVIVGAILTTLTSPSSPALHLSVNDLSLGLLFAIVGATVMGVDLPESNGPFARLT